MERVRYDQLQTKVSKKELMREKLATNDRWIARGLLTVYENQTVEEQRTKDTKEHNGVGFTGVDAEILTDMSQKLIQRGGFTASKDHTRPFTLSNYFSPKQIDILKKKMPKYWQQLMNAAEQKQDA